MNIIFNTLDGMIDTAVAAPQVGVNAAFCGYVFARFANMPLQKTTEAFAIWAVAYNALMTLSESILGKMSPYDSKSKNAVKLLTKVSLFAAFTYYGIKEIEKRGFMNNNFRYLIIAIQLSAFIARLNQFDFNK